MPGNDPAAKGYSGGIAPLLACNATSMAFADGTEQPSNDVIHQIRDIADVPAVEVVTTVCVHLMSAAAVKCGLAEDGEDDVDLAEARILIEALAGIVNASAPWLGNAHAAPLRDGLASLQGAFAEASAFPDAPGEGPGGR